jgi:PPE-repeat protein
VRNAFLFFNAYDKQNLMAQTYIQKMTGYKATDKNLKCRDHQFVIGEWSPAIEGDLQLCAKGYHFCAAPSGVWSYYMDATTRVFTCEAECVLDVPIEAGAEAKHVARRIRLVDEITPGKIGDKNSNTGDRNTGDRNTGDSNTGYSNTGDSNTGDRNTGDRNTGYSNTGDSNTGYSNTGDRNTGHSNTGDSNTGDRNTGDSNTGYSNTGDSNTGYSNATNNSAGFFCICEPRVISFDKQTRLTRLQYLNKYPESYDLGKLLLRAEPIDFESFKRIPGITAAKLKALHRKHLLTRKLITE